ncbi:hypothetical protein LEP1GSC073_3778 [Leptospira noguchii str. Cascata]|nr:hypothetical protein LEP1GSC073_3778 [Leptospira noguchii str. Cascata]
MEKFGVSIFSLECGNSHFSEKFLSKTLENNFGDQTFSSNTLHRKSQSLQRNLNL